MAQIDQWRKSNQKHKLSKIKSNPKNKRLKVRFDQWRSRLKKMDYAPDTNERFTDMVKGLEKEAFSQHFDMY